MAGFHRHQTAAATATPPMTTYHRIKRSRSIGNADDIISNLPDECLAYILKSLSSLDRETWSLVCRRWLRIEGQSRHRLSLTTKSDCILPALPSLFTRFDAVTALALKCGTPSGSGCECGCASRSRSRSVPRFGSGSFLISDDALLLISLHCPNLIRLELHSCVDLTDSGMANFALNCKGLKELYCDFCNFGAKGMNAVLDHCSSLEDLSVESLSDLTADGSCGGSTAAMPIGPGVAANSLKTICIKKLYNNFAPLIIGSKNLRTLKIDRCVGDWDKVFEDLANDQRRVTSLVEVHLEALRITDKTLFAISKYCSDLEILHLAVTPNCTNAGLVSIADHCKLLRELHIHEWSINDKIGDAGLIAIAKRCPNLAELILFCAIPTSLSLGLLAANCQKLERLALCWCPTIGDAEISCIAAKCIALKNLCIMGCRHFTDDGMKAFSSGFPNVEKVTIWHCSRVTCGGVDWLKAQRGSLALNLYQRESDPCPFWADVKRYFKTRSRFADSST